MKIGNILYVLKIGQNHANIHLQHVFSSPPLLIWGEFLNALKLTKENTQSPYLCADVAVLLV